MCKSNFYGVKAHSKTIILRGVLGKNVYLQRILLCGFVGLSQFLEVNSMSIPH